MRLAVSMGMGREYGSVVSAWGVMGGSAGGVLCFRVFAEGWQLARARVIRSAATLMVFFIFG
jgi:hypothetical protein